MQLPHHYSIIAEKQLWIVGVILLSWMPAMRIGESPVGFPCDPDASPALPASLRRVLEWLRGHLSESVQLDRLADIAGVRPRTLEAQFRVFLGTTPLGWVRQMRLALARRELLHANCDTSVTEVALSVGFSQLGRFSVQYRKAFGESPSSTLRQSERRTEPEIDEAIRSTYEALPFAFAVSPRHCNRALEALARPQELAPAYGLPKALAGWCFGQRAAHRFSSTPAIDRKRAQELAERAFQLAPRDALTLTLSSGALVLLHQMEEADRRLERALALDPWLAYAWIRRGWMSAYLGDSDGAIRELSVALHLMPFEPLRHITFIGLGCAYFAAERYEQAAHWIGSAVNSYPGSFWAERIAVAAVALTGARTQARRKARSLLRKDPDLTVAEARQAWPFRPSFMSRLGDGLEMAELPRA